jgi:hypothetical protein
VPFEQQVASAAANRYERAKVTAADRMEFYVVGFEYQMIDDGAHPDALRGGSHISGSLYDMIAPAKRVSKPAGEWNQSRIVVKGDHIEHWLNGVKVVDGSLTDPAIEQNVTRRWKVAPTVYEALTKRPQRSCPISLQNHNDEAWFRNLKIRRLN